MKSLGKVYVLSLMSLVLILPINSVEISNNGHPYNVINESNSVFVQKTHHTLPYVSSYHESYNTKPYSTSSSYYYKNGYYNHGWRQGRSRYAHGVYSGHHGYHSGHQHGDYGHHQHEGDHHHSPHGHSHSHGHHK